MCAWLRTTASMAAARTETARRLRAGASRTALDHAAVQQQLAAARPQDVAGTGHFSRGAEKLQLHAGRTLTSRASRVPQETAMNDTSKSASRPPQLPHRRCGHRHRPVRRHPLRGEQVRQARRGDRATALQPNAFVRVAPDDTVTVVIGKSEMGQGIYTGLAMAVAEELDVDPARVQGGDWPARIRRSTCPSCRCSSPAAA